METDLIKISNAKLGSSVFVVNEDVRLMPYALKPNSLVIILTSAIANEERARVLNHVLALIGEDEYTAKDVDEAHNVGGISWGNGWIIIDLQFQTTRKS